MGRPLAVFLRIFQTDRGGVVKLNGPVHARPFAGTSGRVCRRQRDVRRHREDGAGTATCRRVGHRSKNDLGVWRVDGNAPKACELQLAAPAILALAPWAEASKRFLEGMQAVGGNQPLPNWREAFAKWSEISNEELIRNQRGDGFLHAQKELLQSGLKLRSRQDDVAEAASAMFGMPGRKDFDEVTRQLTELRREVRALSHRVHAQERGARSTRSKAGDTVASSDVQPNAQ